MHIDLFTMTKCDHRMIYLFLFAMAKFCAIIRSAINVSWFSDSGFSTDTSACELLRCRAKPKIVKQIQMFTWFKDSQANSNTQIWRFKDSQADWNVQMQRFEGSQADSNVQCENSNDPNIETWGSWLVCNEAACSKRYAVKRYSPNAKGKTKR